MIALNSSVWHIKPKGENMEKNVKMLNDIMHPVSDQTGLTMDGYWVWDSSVIKGEDGRYHMFASRWPRSLPFHPGWMLESEVVRAVCDRPDGVFQFEEVVLPSRGAQYWDGRSTHNPHIIKYKDKYVLYYTGFTHPFPDVKEGEMITVDDPRVICSRASKRIGVAYSDSVYGPWIRMDEPVLDIRPDYFDSFLTSNAAPCITEDGKILLMYKTRSYAKRPYPEYLHGQMLFGVAMADSPFEKHKAILEKPLFFDNDNDEGFELEDPFIWRDADGYHMMAKDMNGKVCGEEHSGVYAESKNGIDWEFKKDFVYYSRKLKFEDGTVRTLGNMERPFLLFEDGKPICAYFAVSDGTWSYLNCTRTWSMPILLK